MEGGWRPAPPGNLATGALATRGGGTEGGSRKLVATTRESCFCARTLSARVSGPGRGWSLGRRLGDATISADLVTFVSPPWRPQRSSSRSSPRRPRSGTCPGRKRPSGGCGQRGPGGRAGRRWLEWAGDRTPTRPLPVSPGPAAGIEPQRFPPTPPSSPDSSVLFRTFASCHPLTPSSICRRRSRLSHLVTAQGFDPASPDTCNGLHAKVPSSHSSKPAMRLLVTF